MNSVTMYLLKEASRKAKPLIRIAAASALLVALIAGPNVPQASAEDPKIYPGSNCVQFAGPATKFLFFSLIGNSSTTSLIRLDCIGINDLPTKGIKKGSVSVIDKNPTQAVECQMVSIHINDAGDVVAETSPIMASAGNSPALQVLSFDGLTGNPAAHYFFGCSIPPQTASGSSAIVSYRLSE